MLVLQIHIFSILIMLKLSECVCFKSRKTVTPLRKRPMMATDFRLRVVCSLSVRFLFVVIFVALNERQWIYHS